MRRRWIGAAWPLALAATLAPGAWAAPGPLPRDLSGPWNAEGSGALGPYRGTVWIHQESDARLQLRASLRTAAGQALSWSASARLDRDTVTASFRLRAQDGRALGDFTASWVLSADDTRLRGVWAPARASQPRWHETLSLPVTTPSSPAPAATSSGPAPIGVLLASHGDVDRLDEVEDYVRTAFVKNSAVPLPDWLRPPLAGPAWQLSRSLVTSQYEVIGATRYRERSRQQCQALEQALRAAGVQAVVEHGFNFTHPFVDEGLARLRAAGARRIVVINQGAQFSYATGGENIKDVLDYLEAHPEWRPEIVAVKEFSSDPRFRRLLGDVIERDVRAAFPGVPREDICVLMVSHGLPVRLVEMGDPATAQMLEVVDELRGRLRGYGLEHGFLNDDFFPGAAWTEPKASEVAHRMTLANWPCVFVDSRLSFSVHHRATLFDADVEAREILEEEPPTLADGSPDPRLVRTRVVFGRNFDDDPGFARLLAELTREALAGQGRIVRVERGMTVTP